MLSGLELHDAQPWAELDARASNLLTPCGSGEMVWRSWGHGDRPLVLLHGGAGSWLHWIDTIPAFSQAHRVVVPDLPGLGESAPPPKGAGGVDIALIIAAGLDALIGADTPCDLVGFSFGGVMAGLVASFRGAVRSLTLVGSGGLGVIKGARPLQRVRDKAGTAREQAHRANLHAWMIADPARIDRRAIAIQDWNSRHSRLDTRSIGLSDLLRPALPKVRAPIAGIWGARDHAMQGEPHRAEAALRAVRPDTDFRIIPNAGHWVAYETPELFVRALRETLNAADMPQARG
jgi:pimeloyl-ACP methyl ester carboxylesterase